MFIGTNGIQYKHVYYIGKSEEEIELEINMKNKDQYTEIKNIEWVSEEESYNKIREYNLSKMHR